jgi:hypothetical protein
MKNGNKVVAEIALYGNTRTCGAGYIATRLDTKQMFGDGEPKKDRGYTEALWAAAHDLQESGLIAGDVIIYEPNGQLMARAPVAHIPSFGGLQWENAPQLAIGIDRITAADVLAEGK